MGRPDSKQPRHSAPAEPSIRLSSRRRGRSKSASRQRDSPTKLSPPAVDEPTSQPPSPSPLIDTLSEEYYDAREGFPPTSSIFMDEDGDVFYDAYQAPSEHKPVLTSVQQIIPEPQYDGAAKGAINRRSGPARNTTASQPLPTSPSTATPPLATFGGFSFSSNRGSTKPTVSPAGPSAATLAAQEARKAVPPSPPSVSPRPAVKRALIIGMNYSSWGADRRLYYAINDAKLWRDTLIGKGVAPENIRTITDDGEMRDAPSYNNLLGSIQWLVQDTRAGDSLFFVFSGHAVLTQNYGPSMLTADKMIFPRPLLERELVMAVPKGADLQVVFDCCHSAGMIGLQYCVGRMAKPNPISAFTPSPEQQAEKSAVCPLESKPSESQRSERTGTALPRPPSPYSHAPQQASLFGIHAAEDTPQPPARPPVTPDVVSPDTFGTPPQRHSRGGVVAAPSLPDAAAAATAAGNQQGLAATAVSYLTSFMGYGTTASTSTPAPAQTPASPEPPAAPVIPGLRRANQGVVEGSRMPDYFEERKAGFVTPAGKVMVWAGAGEHQQAFETYGRSRQGIVTKAMCSALAPCLEQEVTCRDLWSCLVQEIDGENQKRMKRDAGKSVSERQLPHLRVQHAELWVSQCDPLDPLRSAGPVLDRPML